MKILFKLFLLLPLFTMAQNSVSGVVYEAEDIPIVGAEIYWENTNIGTITNEKGAFEIPYTKEYKNH